jgi:hypothetical protein
MKPDLSASEPETVAIMESSEGSSSEVNSSVGLGEAQIAEGDEIQAKLYTEVKAFKTHNSTRDFAAGSSGVSKRVHQLCVIITEAEEENNHEGNEGVDRQVDKIREHNKKEKEKIHVSAREWRIIMSAINHGTEVPEGSRREVLMGYQYALHLHKKKLREQRDMFVRSRDNNSMSREEYWDDYSDDSEYSRERRKDPKQKRGTTAQSREERYSRSMTPQLEEEEEDFVQETPEAALIAAQAYLLTTRPEPGDPREDMHQAAIRSLGIVEDKIMGKGPEAKSTSYKKGQKEKFKHKITQNESSESSKEERRQKRKEDARNIIAQARVNKSRHAWREENYEDDENEMGALCFTRRVRKTRVPKGFKLPQDQQKYDGSQEPTLWLLDYLQAVQILGESMQSLQLHLTGAGRSWLNTLPNESIGSWGDLESQFVRDFRSTYKRPTSLEEVKACVQSKGETLRSYIQRWSVIKNLVEDVSDERAIDAFSAGLHCSDLVDEIGRTRPTTVAELMEEANRFANREDAYNNKRGRSPEADRTSRQRRRHRNRDNQGRRNQVAVGYEAKEEEGYENRKFQVKRSRKTEILRPFGRRHAIWTLLNPLRVSRWKESLKPPDEGL